MSVMNISHSQDFHIHLDPERANHAPKKAILSANGPGRAIPEIIKRKEVTAIYFGVINELQLLTVVQNMPQLKILHVSHYHSAKKKRYIFTPHAPMQKW